MEALQLGLPAIVLIILVALAFDFINGLHDAANSIATLIARCAADRRQPERLRPCRVAPSVRHAPRCRSQRRLRPAA